MYNNLRFFKGTDYDLNFVQGQAGIWTGTVYLDEVSTGLYESVNLFILEETKYNGDVNYNMPVADGNAPYTLDFEWNDTAASSKDIFMYDAKTENGIIKINTNEKYSASLIDWSKVDSIDQDGFLY